MAKKFSCEIKPYQLKFKSPAQTSRDTMKVRDIWTLMIEDNYGKYGYGEVAPLPGLSLELKKNFDQKLVEVSENIAYFMENKLDLLAYPSILFGLESAMLSYKHRDYIFYNTPFTNAEKPLPINALVWMGDFIQMKSQIDEILQKEVKCIKLKIGGIDFNQEIELLQHIRKYRSEKTLEIRLDANGAFLTNEVLTKLKILSDYHIHSIEQPILPGMESDMLHIVKNSPIPIALDEELIGKNQYKEKWNLLEKIHPDYIVLKPSLHGGIVGCEEWIFIAEQMKIGWWITSALESNLGLNVISQWCSKYETCYQFPQGLGTGNLYENNLPTHLMLKDYELYIDKEG